MSMPGTPTRSPIMASDEQTVKVLKGSLSSFRTSCSGSGQWSRELQQEVCFSPIRLFRRVADLRQMSRLHPKKRASNLDTQRRHSLNQMVRPDLRTVQIPFKLKRMPPSLMICAQLYPPSTHITPTLSNTSRSRPIPGLSDIRSRSASDPQTTKALSPNGHLSANRDTPCSSTWVVI